MRFLLPLLFICFGLQAANPPSEFRTHTIEPEFPGGYALILLDVNNDGRLDVVGVSGRITELAWYENPSWERHVINDTLRRIVNLAAHDVDGDGIPEIAIQSEFSMKAAQSEMNIGALVKRADRSNFLQKLSEKSKRPRGQLTATRICGLKLQTRSSNQNKSKSKLNIRLRQIDVVYRQRSF